jgi:hypothetical protein
MISFVATATAVSIETGYYLHSLRPIGSPGSGSNYSVLKISGCTVYDATALLYVIRSVAQNTRLLNVISGYVYTVSCTGA